MRLRGLWNPFLLEAGGELPAGRRVEALLWDDEGYCGDTLPPDSSGKTPLERGLLDASLALTLPGLVSGHAEPAVQLLLPGLSVRDGEPLDATARRLSSALDREELSIAAQLCAAEAAVSGVTLVYVLHRGAASEGVLDVIADAFRVIGVRVVAAVDADEKNRDASAAKAAIAENVRFAQACAAKGDAMAGAMMGLSAPDALPTLLAEAVSAARKAEMGFHLVLRDPPEWRRRIAEKAALRPGSVAVLEAALDDEERALLRDLQVVAVTTPRDDSARGMAPPPVRGLGRNLVLGGLDVLAERDAFAIARGPALREEKAPLWRLLSNGWDLAAETLDRTFGRWNEGAQADLVVIDEPLPAPLTPSGLPAHILGAGAKHVRHVVVNGTTIVRDGTLVTADLRALRAEARTAAARAWARGKG